MEDEATQRRYLEGFFAGLRVRPDGGGAVATVATGTNGHGGELTPPSEAAPTDPWRTLLACAEEDRPPRAGERAGLAALGVVDLAPEGRDGCRVRLRAAPGGRLWAWQLRELADVAQECAGGFITLGDGPGNGPELAVVGWRETAGALARLRAMGWVPGGNGGVGAVRCSPAAGLDAGEIFDVMPLAQTLTAALRGEGAPRVGLDGGASGWTLAPGDDLTLRAARSDEVREVIFAVTTAGGAARFGLPAARAASAVLALAEIYRDRGTGWDGSDADGTRAGLERLLDEHFPEVPELPAPVERPLWPGIFPQKQPGRCALVAAGPADGLWRGRALRALAGLAEELGGGGPTAGEARLWPGGVLVSGVAAERGDEGLGRLAEVVALVR